MNPNLTIEDEIRASMAEGLEDKDETVDVAEVDETDEILEETADELVSDVVDEMSETKEEGQELVEADEYSEPPVSLKGEIKAKWKELPADVRAEWKRREDDIHRMMTSHDGELRLGRSVKEIAQPYEAIIRSEGGTVEGAFKDLMNTAYILRAGTPQQKAQAVMEAVRQFNVDLNLANQQNNQQHNQNSLYQEIENLKKMANPDVIKNSLKEEIERDRILNEINAFKSDPANVHFETVKSIMGTLIETGQAKDLKDAYEKAIWSEPSIRETLLKAQKVEENKVKKAEMERKKKASASVVGSNSASPNANAPIKSIEDEIRESLRASTGKI